MTVPPEPNRADGADEPAPPDFDPYRYGKPDHPIPPEYAPPGYVPPVPPAPAAPSPAQYPGYSYPPPPPGYPPYGAPRAGNGKATIALVLGILSIVFCWLSIFDLVLAVPAGQTGFGSFLEFETVTLCPIDTRCVVRERLSADEIAWLDAYHARVRECLLPLVDGAARDWLLARTEAL